MKRAIEILSLSICMVILVGCNTVPKSTEVTATEDTIEYSGENDMLDMEAALRDSCEEKELPSYLKELQKDLDERKYVAADAKMDAMYYCAMYTLYDPIKDHTHAESTAITNRIAKIAYFRSFIAKQTHRYDDAKTYIEDAIKYNPLNPGYVTFSKTIPTK